IVSSFDYLESSDANNLYKKNKYKWLELPFGVDIERFYPQPKPGALFDRLGFSKDISTIIFVGGMDEAHYFKGVSVLIKALAFLKGQKMSLQAIFVGDGDLKEGFEKKAEFYGISENTRFVGRILDEELPSYYNMADLCILPSINRGEAFGLVLVEAMASGVPVLATDLPGVRSVAQDGGFIVEPNNTEALARGIFDYFSKNIDELKLKEQVRKIAIEKYSLDVVVKSLEDEYKKFVD
ncbi:glycosyltransferase family 4 protein, partial [Patescibacteria group bacterium]|nr:glycosyltransferase family 4 protein [Patescibacteria group bacterium]